MPLWENAQGPVSIQFSILQTLSSLKLKKEENKKIETNRRKREKRREL
jgi:hypothetical protein